MCFPNSNGGRGCSKNSEVGIENKNKGDDIISLAMRKINPKTITKLTRFFHSKIIPYLSKSLNRGRPRIYKDHQIISMLIIMEVFSLSFRETIILSRDYFKNVPSLRDFHYRVRKLKHVIQILIKFIHDYLEKDIDSIIVDGTGIGFKKKASLN